jgi:hypothetical protein
LALIVAGSGLIALAGVVHLSRRTADVVAEAIA